MDISSDMNKSGDRTLVSGYMRVVIFLNGSSGSGCTREMLLQTHILELDALNCSSLQPHRDPNISALKFVIGSNF
eukprot:3888028-Amphidinium_carterae.1